MPRAMSVARGDPDQPGRQNFRRKAVSLKSPIVAGRPLVLTFAIRRAGSGALPPVCNHRANNPQSDRRSSTGRMGGSMKRRTLLGGAMAAAVLGPVTRLFAQAAPIKIGMSMAQTGGLARRRQGGAARARDLGDDVNAKGGLLGRKVELVVYDDQSKPADDPGDLHQAARRRQGRPAVSRPTRRCRPRRSCRSSSSATCC